MMPFGLPSFKLKMPPAKFADTILFNLLHQQSLRVEQKLFFGPRKLCGLHFNRKMPPARFAYSILFNFLHQQTLRVKQKLFFGVRKVCGRFLFNFLHQQSLRVKQKLFFGLRKLCGLHFNCKMVSASFAHPILFCFFQQQIFQFEQ